MNEAGGDIVVGILGQYVSGKSEAARTLARHLGGEGQAVSLNDRVRGAVPDGSVPILVDPGRRPPGEAGGAEP